LINFSRNIYSTHKEKILYLIVGGMTTAITYIVFFILNIGIGLVAWLSYCFTWVVAASFAYIANKFFVFESKKIDKTTITRELKLFIIARLMSLAIGALIAFVFIDLLGFNTPLQAFIILTIDNIIVIIFNYIASKYFVFKKSKHF